MNATKTILTLLCTFGLVSAGFAAPTEITVAADGSGQYRTIQAGIDAAPTGSPDAPVIIHVKPGVYHEVVYVQREKRYVHLVGDNPNTTVITYGLYAGMRGLDGKKIGTFRTPTFQLDADDFTAENITFENSAGPVGQALAIRVDGDKDVFRNCRFLGWQDTIFVNRGRQYFQGCYVAGHVDYIFGGATSYFDHCELHCLGGGYVTAASTPRDQAYGFVFRDCTINGDAKAHDFLGRPWRAYSAVTYINTTMSDIVRPAGWDNWRNPAKEKTARYYEYGSKGPGAEAAKRVSWARTLTAEQAAALTPDKVLAGCDGWHPVP